MTGKPGRPSSQPRSTVSDLAAAARYPRDSPHAATPWPRSSRIGNNQGGKWAITPERKHTAMGRLHSSIHSYQRFPPKR